MSFPGMSVPAPTIASAENWKFEAMYRYADLGEIEVGPFSTGDTVTYGRVFSHEFVFGIAYYF